MGRSQLQAARAAVVALITLLLATVDATFHSSELTSTNDYRFYPLAVHAYSDLSVIIVASASSEIDNLGLHPEVIVPTNRSNETSENFLVMRMHRITRQVQWARIITGFEYTLNSAIDSDRNIYLVGPFNYFQEGFYGLIKITQHGGIVWTRRYRGHGPDTGGIEAEHLVWSQPGVLVTNAVKVSVDFGLAPYAAVLSTSNGSILRYVALSRPDLPAYSIVTSIDVVGRTACVATTKEVAAPSTTASHRLFIFCFNHRTGKDLRVREITTSPATIFPRFVHIALQHGSRYHRFPELHIVYEQVFNFSYNVPRGKSKAQHEIVLRRLCSKTLQDAPWPKSRSVATQTYKLPTPVYPDFAIAIDSIRYVPRIKGIALLFSTTLNLTGSATLTHEDSCKGRKNFELPGTNGYIFPTSYWMLFVNRAGQPTVVPIQPSEGLKTPPPFTRLIIQGFSISKCSRKAFILGLLEVSIGGSEAGTGWFDTYAVPVPVSRWGGRSVDRYKWRN